MQPQDCFRVVRDEPDEPLEAIEASSRELDLPMLLSAWQMATNRLEQTHLTLRAEVKRLTDELEIKNRELARKNRLADLGQMAAHVAHEVRNSLVPMTLYLSLLRRRLDQDRGSLDVVDKISSGLTALEATVTDLLGFTTDRQPEHGDVAVRTLIDEIGQSLWPQLTAQGIVWRVELPAEARLWADREMLRRALFNLALNAIDAMPDGGELVITSWCGPQEFELEIADSGAGIPRHALQRIFDPFFTTKREGTGLGLAMVQRIIEAHGATIRAANCPEGGAAFTLRFPRRTALERAA